MSTPVDLAATAATSTLSAMFEPEAVVVIGASREPGRIGHSVVKNLTSARFEGRIYGVNPSGGVGPGGVDYLASLAELPEVPDLAVICLPAAKVVDAVRECADAGVGAAIVIAADMGEEGGEGSSRADDLAAIQAETGIRILGPNTNGFFSRGGANGDLLATFSRTAFTADGALPDRPEQIAVVGQGGGLTTYVGFEITAFSPCFVVDTGNELDVTLADCLRFLAAGSTVTAIALVIESSRNGRDLAAAVRECRALGIRVSALMLGRTHAGMAAASLHTGALASGSVALWHELEAAGAYVTGDERDFAAIASHPPLARTPHAARPRIAILSWSGGFGVHMADLLAERHVPLATFSIAPDAVEVEALRSVVPPNPLDLGGFSPRGGGPGAVERLGTSLGFLARQPEVDATILFESTVFERREEYEAHLPSLAEAIARYGKPVYLCGGFTAEAERELRRIGVQPFRYPSDLAATLQADGPAVVAETEHAPPAPATASGGTRTAVGRAAAVSLAAADVPVVRSAVVDSADDLTRLAAEFGLPVVLKLEHADLLHKSEHGAVRIAPSVAQAVADYGDLTRVGRDLGLTGAAVTIEEFASGLEMVVGTLVDPDLGPTVMVGRGGVDIEVVRDMVFALAPVDETRARAMLQTLKCWPLLDGKRATTPYDVDALAALVSRVSVFASDNADRIAGVDLNPVMVRPQGRGVIAADAVVVENARP